MEYIAGRGRDASHASLVLSQYFHVNMSATGRPLSLVDAVEFVEAEGTAGEFLLVGHPDGGLISVSRERLAFQVGFPPIDWWGP
ncbi:MAG TPA: hypothetical protein VG757_17205 [Devosia sp.]|nr:hypothetical protein [Devosia sp.]